MNKYFGFRQKSNVLANVRVGADSATVKSNEDQSGLAAAGGLIAVVAIVAMIPTVMFVSKYV